MYGFVKNKSPNLIDAFGMFGTIGGGQGWGGLWHWLLNGEDIQLRWSEFDNIGGYALKDLKKQWKSANDEFVRSKCETMSLNSTEDILRPNPQIRNVQYASSTRWIGRWLGGIYGDTTGGKKNLNITKAEDSKKRCVCLAYADVIATANDEGDFNRNENFTVSVFDLFNITMSDNVPLWFHDNLLIGVNYKIFAHANDQVIWQFQYNGTSWEEADLGY